MNIATKRAAIAAGLAALTLPLAAAPAAANSAGAVTATGSGAAAGYEDVFNGENATIETFTIEDGLTVEALCVQLGVALDRNVEFTAVTRDSAGVAGVGEAAWIGANHRSVGTPLTDIHLEATAVQLAAWSFTDGTSYDADNLPNATVRDRVDELVSAAGSLSASPVSYALDVTAERDGGALVATASATADGAPLADAEITFTIAGSAEGELTATTDALGEATIAATDVDGDGELSATMNAVLKAGTLLQPADGGQMVVTTQDAPITRSASTTFDAIVVDETATSEEPPAEEAPEEPADEPTEDTPTEKTSEPEPEPVRAPDGSDELPFTGPALLLLPLGALAAGGAGAYGFKLRKDAASRR